MVGPIEHVLLQNPRQRLAVAEHPPFHPKILLTLRMSFHNIKQTTTTVNLYDVLTAAL